MKFIKEILKFMLICVITFLLIYLLVFIGGWKLFESGNPILIEIGISILVGLILYTIYTINEDYKRKITELEKRLIKLESSKK